MGCKREEIRRCADTIPDLDRVTTDSAWKSGFPLETSRVEPRMLMLQAFVPAEIQPG